MTMIRGIKIAPDGLKCMCCWTELTEDDRKLGSSYATLDLFSSGQGLSCAITVYFCKECGEAAALAAHSKIGLVLLSDAVESCVRTLVRLSEDLKP